MEIKGYHLVQTSSACPEQYDVFKDDDLVGYLRLRNGWFRADYPQICSHGGDTIYESYPKGDGMFDDDERIHYLTEAINAIDDRIKNGTQNIGHNHD